MKTVFVLFDSLNRRSLGPYGAQSIKTPNFDRLAERSVTFDTHYVGSLPCMPARRDMMTGRLSFLHRSWGPLEPFDNSFPELLGEAGIYSHLVTDHSHYWEDGGATYHNRYNSYEFIRGQERDPWKAMVQPPWERLREKYHEKQFSDKPGSFYHNHIINREFIREEKDFPSVQCFDAGFEFLEENRSADDWFLQIETFDPHEPFFAPEGYRKDYPTDYEGPIFDWPRYDRVTEAPEESEELRANYSAILALCDAQMGRLLDYFDEHDMWSDTALVVSTDHGYLLGEHDWWAKVRMPAYNEVAHIPLFIHHPDFASKAGEHRKSLTQTIDLMPTFLDLNGVSLPPEVEGTSLINLLRSDTPIREAAIYGVWGSATNITDGRYTYFRYPDDLDTQEIFQYTLMPMHAMSLFSPDVFRNAELVEPFNFTKGAPLLKIPGHAKPAKNKGLGIPNRSLAKGFFQDNGTVLFDTSNDPNQLSPIDDTAVEERLKSLMRDLMETNDAPTEAYRRFDLE
jgi:arylsulfatase A-like enzyme